MLLIYDAMKRVVLIPHSGGVGFQDYVYMSTKVHGQNNSWMSPYLDI